jgi:hypothetical protein
MAKISNSRTIQIVKGILDAETKEMSHYKLATDMIREAGIPDLKFDEILAQLSKLKQGLVEGIERKPQK